MSIFHANPERELMTDGLRTVLFILLDRFSMLSFSAALETLKVANDVIGRPAYQWEIIGADEAEVLSGNGVTLAADSVLSEVKAKTRSFGRSDIVYLFAGSDIEGSTHPEVGGVLRRAIREGARVVAFDTGAFWLANAGLMSGRNCAIHWEAIPAFEERFGLQTQVSREIFVEDGAITTCAGACSAIDLGLHLLAQHHGDHIARRVSEIVLVDRPRSSNERQRLPLQAQLGKADDRFVRAIELMFEGHDRLLAVDRIAEAVNLSRRQLERMFRSEVGLSPSRYHLMLRMERAHLLLCRSKMQIVEVAASCGFRSSSHFSKTYKSIYGVAPQQSREVAHRPVFNAPVLLNQAFHRPNGDYPFKSIPLPTAEAHDTLFAMAS